MIDPALVDSWPSQWPEELGRLAAVIPHPDDEIFIAGLLATAASASVDVTVIAATRGEAGNLRGSSKASSHEVASKRTAELKDSCALLGIGEIVHLDLPDGKLDHSDVPLSSQLLEAVEKTKCDAVVSFDVDGGYGHRDHVAVAEVLATSQARWLRATFPDGLFAKLVLDLSRYAPNLLVKSPPRPNTLVRWKLDLDSDLRAIKRAACRSHRSQLRSDGSFLSPAIEQHLLAQEMYGE